MMFTLTWSPRISAGIATKKTSKIMTVGQVAKSVTKYAIPMSICADLAGLEWTSHREIGEAVGITGNIASGALMGTPFGLCGAAIGALGGFAVWGAEEIINGLLDRTIFGEMIKNRRLHNEYGDGNAKEHAGHYDSELKLKTKRSSSLPLNVEMRKSSSIMMMMSLMLLLAEK